MKYSWEVMFNGIIIYLGKVQHSNITIKKLNKQNCWSLTKTTSPARATTVVKTVKSMSIPCITIQEFTRGEYQTILDHLRSMEAMNK